LHPFVDVVVSVVLVVVAVVAVVVVPVTEVVVAVHTKSPSSTAQRMPLYNLQLRGNPLDVPVDV
jgi:hypothetical protein